VVCYFLWLQFVVGLRPDHLTILGILVGMFFLSEMTNKVLASITFLLIFGIIFDSMRVIPNYTVNSVYIQELYDLEKSLFGINTANGRLTPNEFLVPYYTPLWDFICGFSYLCWMPVPIMYCIYLYFKEDYEILIQFSFCFLFANIIGISLYYLFPAAPPWYVDMHGFTENYDIPGSSAGLKRFDDLLGITVFQGIYDKSANVFAAIPSMHCAFPLLITHFGLKNKNYLLVIFFVLYMFGTWYGALYTFHHYTVDIILGIFCAIFALVVCEKLLFKSKLKIVLNHLANYIRE